MRDCRSHLFLPYLMITEMMEGNRTKNRFIRYTVIIVAMVLTATVQALNNGLGQKPPMGFSTWYDAGCEGLNEAYVLSVADRLVSTGMAELGYQYVNIDDCWQVTRQKESGVLQVDPLAFPRGMSVLGQEIHKRGLKFGLYTDRGTKTCQKRPGSLQFEIIDATTFAEWGVDYLKEDSCYATSLNHEEAFRQYAVMRDALNATGRPIFFSLCGWNSWYAQRGAQLGNAWRVSPDNLNWNSVYMAAREMERLYMFSGPTGWNDPDFLLASNTSMSTQRVHLTQRQSRTQFSLWCVMAAPLMISGPNVLIPGTFDYETFSNPTAIKVNQDALGIPGRVVYSTCPRWIMPSWTAPIDTPPKGCTQVWAKPRLQFRKNTVALVFVNWDPAQAMQVACDAQCMQLAGIPKGARIVNVKDVWSSDENLTVTKLLFTTKGPGKLSTTLDADGGSAFLLLEFSTTDDQSDGEIV